MKTSKFANSRKSRINKRALKKIDLCLHGAYISDPIRLGPGAVVSPHVVFSKLDTKPKGIHIQLDMKFCPIQRFI